MTNTAIIILAAGNSSRLGSPKQLLDFDGKKLLQNTVDEATKADATLVLVVLGANAKTIRNSLEERKITTLFNPQWMQGMASSICAGVAHVLSTSPAINKIILTVCDQPFISVSILQNLYNKQVESKKGIIAASYAGTTGTPVLFCQHYFQRLLSLQGDQGAKHLLKVNTDDMHPVDFSKGNIDIDTVDDYNKLLSLK
jgi:molybdenum cofactor cytidylyltransferase